MKVSHSNQSIEEHNEEVLKYLFDTYFTRLCQFMYTYWDNKQEIEEQVMDIYVHLWQHPEKIKPDLSIKAYLFQSARNKCLKLIRDKKEILSLDGLEENINTDEPTSLEMQELNELIQKAILAIPANSREIFLKSRNDNLTNQEIAEKMNISLKTVEKHISRSLKIVREIIGDQYIFFIFL